LHQKSKQLLLALRTALLKRELPYQAGPTEHRQLKTEVLCWEGQTNEQKNAPSSHWSFFIRRHSRKAFNAE